MMVVDGPIAVGGEIEDLYEEREKPKSPTEPTELYRSNAHCTTTSPPNNMWRCRTALSILEQALMVVAKEARPPLSFALSSMALAYSSSF